MGNSGSRKKNKDKKRKTKKSSRNEVDIVNIQSQNIDNTRREINDDKLNTSMMGDDSITAGRRINDLITSSNQKGNASPEDITLEVRCESDGNSIVNSLEGSGNAPPVCSKAEIPACSGSNIADHKSPVVMTVKHDKIFVAAIDFGTTYSGYAYCSRDNQSKIFCPGWYSSGHRTYKAPTSVLLMPDRSFYSFGYDAENDFHDMQNEDNFQNWYFFKNFKMLLYTNKDELNAGTEIEDAMTSSNKTKMKAIDVFAIVISYIRNEFLQKVKQSYGASSIIKERDIHWVLTVPGIWDIKAKQFMRDAALKAGIDNEQLSLALEPEAASLYCRNLPMFVEESQDKVKVISQLRIGEKYIVLDQGGGTIDLTVHEVASETTLKEIHQASGGSWGSNMINEKFESFLVDIFGSDVIGQVRKDDPTDYHELLCTFELKKVSFMPKSVSTDVIFKIPYSFLQCYETINNVKFQHGEWTRKYANKVTFSKDKLTIKSTLFVSWMNEAVSNIVVFMQDIFAKEHLRDIHTVLAVGGFSKSKVLMDKLREEHPDVTFIIPEDTDLAVLKGAILYAFDPRCITCRVAQCTYGCPIQMPYDPIKYAGRKKIIGVNNRYMVDHIFHKHVEIGQVLYQDDIPIEHEYFPTIEDHTSISLEFYASSDENPKYTDDASCSFLGVLHFELVQRGRVFVRINASGTELVAIVREEKTNDEFKGYFSLI